jgi:hypothetical protein
MVCAPERRHIDAHSTVSFKREKPVKKENYLSLHPLERKYKLKCYNL